MWEKSSSDYAVRNIMILYFNVFGMCMRNWILCYRNVSLTIIMENGSPRLQTIIPLRDVAKYFTGGVMSNSIFNKCVPFHDIVS